MRRMRGQDPECPHPDVGVRAVCLRQLLCASDDSAEEDYVKEMAGAQWIVDDLFAEIRGMRLQLVEFCKAMSRVR